MDRINIFIMHENSFLVHRSLDLLIISSQWSESYELIACGVNHFFIVLHRTIAELREANISDRRSNLSPA